MANQLTLQHDFTITWQGPAHRPPHFGTVLSGTWPTRAMFSSELIWKPNPALKPWPTMFTYTERGTVLEKDGVQVSTIEHAMAALRAAEIDKLPHRNNGPEMPILDGIAIEFGQGIEQAGTGRTTYAKQYYVVRNLIEVTNPDNRVLPDYSCPTTGLV
jgi:UDP-3-O-[3-hydroxymyristoyl] N-acetylglucosamine deacetylase/3-hydroxyacyl-[acyl-carrier-protein] dehydratase